MLPVLIAVFLGLATVASMMMGKMAVSQAAEQGVQALASGDSPATVNQVVTQTLQHNGVTAAATTSTVDHGSTKSVTVSLPYRLWNTGGSTVLSASRTLTTIASPASGSGSGASGPPATGGGGGGGYVYHHFPMW